MPRSLLAGAFLALLLAPSARAATASVADGRVRFEAAPGEANVLRIARADGGLELSDRAGGLVAGEGCTQILPRRVVCDGEGLVALCGDGRDRIEDPTKTTFVDRSCERVRFHAAGSRTVRNSLTVLAHPVSTTARSATFRIRCAQSSDNDFGEYNSCSGAMSLSAGGRRLGARGFSSRGPGDTFRVRVPLAETPGDAVVAGIDIPDYDYEGTTFRARWSLLLDA
jgi:hypothetical protein